MDENSDPKDDSATPADLFSREGAIKCPPVGLRGYVSKTYGFPKSVFVRQGLLYHYTDAAGLLGIISSNRLWATDASFLNDPSEGQLFPERIIAFMREKVGGLTPSEERIVIQIENGFNKYPRPTHAFTISFCDDGDLLSQWRGYASFGSGYAIGFDSQNITHIQLGTLVEVQYNSEGVKELALDILSILVEAMPKWSTLIEHIAKRWHN
jgi:hypothetical protein